MFKSDVRIQMFFFFFFFMVLGMAAKALYTQGKHSAIELHPGTQNFFPFLKEVAGLVMLLTLGNGKRRVQCLWRTHQSFKWQIRKDLRGREEGRCGAMAVTTALGKLRWRAPGLGSW